MYAYIIICICMFIYTYMSIYIYICMAQCSLCDWTGKSCKCYIYIIRINTIRLYDCEIVIECHDNKNRTFYKVMGRKGTLCVN